MDSKYKKLSSFVHNSTKLYDALVFVPLKRFTKLGSVCDMSKLIFHFVKQLIIVCLIVCLLLR